MPTISRAKAEAALEAVKEQFRTYLEPLTLDSGTVLPGDPPPVLLEGFDGREWTIMWEEGPYEWPFSLGGGSTEEERVLFAAASEEFGTKVKPVERPPAKMPEGLFAEPINHYSVGLYPL